MTQGDICRAVGLDRAQMSNIEAGLDQADVAKLLGKTQPHVSKIEAG